MSDDELERKVDEKMKKIEEHIEVTRLRNDIFFDTLDRLVDLARRQDNAELKEILRDVGARLKETRTA